MISQTLIIVLITAAVSIPAFSNQKIMNDLIMYPPAINRGQVYRLLTSGFIHADVPHLIFNMLTLFFFGNAMERYFGQFGSWVFMLVYLAAIIISSLPSYIKNKNNTYYSSLGASGGVSAILFAFIFLQPWATLSIWFIPCPAIIFAVIYIIYSGYMSKRGGDNINHEAHIYGALVGIIAVLLLDQNSIPRFMQEITNPRFNF